VEKNIYEAVVFHVEGLKEEGLEIPEPSTESEVLVLQPETFSTGLGFLLRGGLKNLQIREFAKSITTARP